MSHRISVDINSEDHRMLKTFCASNGISIKEFVLGTIKNTLEDNTKIKEFQNGFRNISDSAGRSNGNTCN